MYTVDPHTVEKLGTTYMFFSVPLVIYCTFRFAMLVQSGLVSGPTEAATRDLPLVIALALWVLYAVIVVTWGTEIQDFCYTTASARCSRGSRSRAYR